MDRLLSEQAVIDYLITNVPHDDYGDELDADELREMWTERINSIPSAEPQTGKWERKMDGIFCSNCHKGWDFIRGVPAEVETEYKFCPNCGKRMEGEHEI